MSSYEELYLANSLDALYILAKKDCKIKNSKFQSICNMLSKLYKESQLNVLDQEKTYIHLTRFLLLYRDFYNTDHEFVELRFGSEFEKVLAQHEIVEKSLKERYALKATVTEKSPSKMDDMIAEPSPISLVFNDEFISCQQLFSALKSNDNILLVDARTEEDFAKSRFNHKNCINVPDHIITPGLSANLIGRRLTGESMKLWAIRGSFDVIVLYDWNCSHENVPLSKISKLRSALVDWDINCHYKERPVILNGGYIELLQTYPTECINPHVYLYQKNNELDELLEIDDIKYPTESDNKTLVMGEPEDEVPLITSASGDEEAASTTKEELIKEITLSRKNIIEKLLHEEREWKKINELCNNENDLNTRTQLKSKEADIRKEIQHLETILGDLNKQKEDVQIKLEISSEFKTGDEVQDKDLKETLQIDKDDNEKLKILDVVAEERMKALNKARALKPKTTNESANHVEIRETDKPVIDRGTKPVFPPLARHQVGPLENITNGLIGMRNILNTCYMNTIIQCLRNVPDFMRLFCSGMYSKFAIRQPSALIHELSVIVRQLWSQTGKFVDPQILYDKICTLEPTYKMGHHEDCMEFFLFLLNHLKEDCFYPMKSHSVMTPRQKAWYNQFEGKASVFIDLFYHLIRIKQSCSACNHSTFKFEIENSFMLSVPDDDFNLTDLMEEYLADFTIDDYRCAKCRTPVVNTKEFCFQPRVMVIVLKRYRQHIEEGNGLSLIKITSRCSFPTNNFNVAQCLYKLSAVALHQGNMNFGHYTAAALTPKGWYEFNDENIHPVNIHDVDIQKRACSFFYTRCDA